MFYFSAQTRSNIKKARKTNFIGKKGSINRQKYKARWILLHNDSEI